jgi:hypothetical protein
MQTTIIYIYIYTSWVRTTLYQLITDYFMRAHNIVYTYIHIYIHSIFFLLSLRSRHMSPSYITY